MLMVPNLSLSHTRSRYQSFTMHNLHQLPYLHRLSPAQQFAVKVVAQVLPFRTNNYVVESLIDWDNVPDDPLFTLNFPQEGMLSPHHFSAMAHLLKSGASQQVINTLAKQIRCELNPQPAGQLEHNRPVLNNQILSGIQHKYKETILFFPSQGQTCHAYCTFCFRWPQFVGMTELKFAMRAVKTLVDYLKQQTQVSDILFTGGDPLIMRTHVMAAYLEPLLAANLPHLTTIRIGTKSLSFWPYRFLTDPDAESLLTLFRKVVDSGRHLTLMAHFSHPRELDTPAAQEAIARIRQTGAVIRTQSPLLAHINDTPTLWAQMWQKQVALGCIPYYMFIARNTGSQQFFSVPLVQAWHIFRQAYQSVSGITRTVRGPIMSTDPGKIQITGVAEIADEMVFVLRFLQGRNSDWVLRPFFARYKADAIWFDELQPAFGDTDFFFE